MLQQSNAQGKDLSVIHTCEDCVYLPLGLVYIIVLNNSVKSSIELFTIIFLKCFI